MYIVRYIVLLSFFLICLGPLPQVQAQTLALPKLAVEIPTTTAMVKGLTIYPDHPIQFDFIVEPNDVEAGRESLLRDESMKMIKYFLASLTTPEKDMW